MGLNLDGNEPSPDERRDMLARQLEDVPEIADAPQADLVAEAPKSTAPRDPATGKFAPKAASEPATPRAVPGAPVEAETPPAWASPPSSWKKDKHELWSQMDPAAREYAWQRENEMKAGSEPLVAKAQFADKMQAAIAPYENTIRGLGVEPDAAVKALMEADRILRYSAPQEKHAYFLQLAQQYGITLDGSVPPPSHADPIYQIRNELLDVRGQLTSFQQQQQQAKERALASDIDSFAKSAPYFEEARPDMQKLLQSGMADGLEDAYQKALRLNPELFEKSQAGQQAQTEAEKKNAANLAAKSARAAAVSPRSATPGAPPAPKAQDRRSQLAEQFDGLSERL